MAHILITGGAGFIGSHVAAYHLKRGDRVHVVDDLSTGSLANLPSPDSTPNFRFTEADILLWPELHTAAAWADRVYHLAAVVGMFRVLEDPVHVLATNVAGTERLLRAVASSGWKPQVLIASSSEVYGPNERPLLREDDDLVVRSGAVVRWNYAISKLADEALALSYARKDGLPITIVRLFNTVGPHQSGRYGMVLPRFVRQALNAEPITVFGDGRQTRCFCDVRDTVVMLDALLSGGRAAGDIVNLGHDHEITILELAESVKKQLNSDSPIVFRTYSDAYGAGYEDISRRRPCLAKLRAAIDCQPRFGLAATIEDVAAGLANAQEVSSWPRPPISSSAPILSSV